MMNVPKDDDIRALEDRLRNTLLSCHNRAETCGEEVCALAAEVLGPSPESLKNGSTDVGMMNRAGAVEYLEDCGKILENILREETERLSPRATAKFGEMLTWIQRRLKEIIEADLRRKAVEQGIADTRGSFSAFRNAAA
ncbi:hypothetical protein HY285_04305 [Candidatus Peregrinibacteria bacterium]|nr:hypothetical protein [Candidatus Peregrinibacteria bacterium]MBI3816736.1 hypothetical protein [Candidatus Peregrinibacteria bacterium]